MYLLHSHFILKLLVCWPVGFIGSTQWGQSLYDVTLIFFTYYIIQTSDQMFPCQNRKGKKIANTKTKSIQCVLAC